MVPATGSKFSALRRGTGSGCAYPREYVLFPHSPELNDIEKLSHETKHICMDVKCRVSQILEIDVSHILDNFESAYKIDL